MNRRKEGAPRAAELRREKKFELVGSTAAPRFFRIRARGAGVTKDFNRPVSAQRRIQRTTLARATPKLAGLPQFFRASHKLSTG